MVAVGPPTLHLRMVSGVTKEENEGKGRRKQEERKRKFFSGERIDLAELPGVSQIPGPLPPRPVQAATSRR